MSDTLGNLIGYSIMLVLLAIVVERLAKAGVHFAEAAVSRANSMYLELQHKLLKKNLAESSGKPQVPQTPDTGAAHGG